MDNRMEISHIGPFVLGKTLGSGTTGKVKLAFHKETGAKVAIKIINKDYLATRQSVLKKVEREIAAMKVLDHPSVLKLYDVYETEKYLFLVLEYVEGGELFDFLIKRGRLDSQEALIVFQQILLGVDYCHNRLICHRDLKPENLLLDEDKNIKIADFGMASLMKKGNLLSTSCGSPHYASPEVVQGVKYDGSAADVWSCGVILYALLTGKLPFDDDNIRRLLNKVKSGIFSMPPILHKDVKDLIWKMLVVDPTKRITINQIKENPWFRSNRVEIPITVNLFENNMDIEIDVNNIDEEVVRSLHSLGWGTENEVREALLLPNQIQKFFYHLLLERKQTPTQSLYSTPTNRGRVYSAPSPVSPQSPLISSPYLSSSPSPSPRPLRVITQIPVLSNLSLIANTTTPPPSPMISSSSSSSSSVSSYNERRMKMMDEKNSEGRPGRFLSLSGTHLPTSLASSATSNSSIPSALINSSPSVSSVGNEGGNDRIAIERNRGRRASLTSSGGSIGMSINNTSNRFHRMKIESQNNTPPGSPIIGSSPKRSWFSTFFSNTGKETKKDKSFSMQSPKTAEIIILNLQKVFKKYHIIWDSIDKNAISARHRSLSSPSSLKFRAEVRGMGDGAHNLVVFDFISGETEDFVNIWQMIEPDLIEAL